MAAGNETNNFVRDGSMLPHHDIDTTTTPNSWKPNLDYLNNYFVWEPGTPVDQLKPLYPIEFGTHMDGGRIDIDGMVQMWGHASSVASGEVVEEHPLPMAVLDNKYNATLQKLAYSQISQVGDTELISQVVDSQNYFTVKQGLQTNTHLRYFTVSPITEAPNFFHFNIVGAHV